MENIIKFGDIEIEKQNLTNTKEPTTNIDINKIIVSSKLSFDKNGFKLFIGYKDAKKFRALCIVPPKMTACRKDFDEIKYVIFDKRWWIIRKIYGNLGKS